MVVNGRRSKDLQKEEDIILGENVGYKWANKNGTFNEGYFIGQLLGDNTYFIDDDRLYIDVCVPEKVNIETYGPYQNIRKLLAGLKIQCEEQKNRIKIYNYRQITEKYGVRPTVYEKGSYEFSKGLLRSLFDTYGMIFRTQGGDVSVRLIRTDLKHLQAVQRILLAMGIYSTNYNFENRKELVIVGDQIRRFYDIIGFSDSNRMERLTYLLNQNLNPKKMKFTSKILNIIHTGIEDVYDCTISGKHCVSANGIISQKSLEILEKVW